MTLSLKTLSLRVKVKSFKVLCELDLIPTLPHDLRALSLLFFPVLAFVWPHPPTHTPTLPQISQTDSWCRILYFLLSPLLELISSWTPVGLPYSSLTFYSRGHLQWAISEHLILNGDSSPAPHCFLLLQSSYQHLTYHASLMHCVCCLSPHPISLLTKMQAR